MIKLNFLKTAKIKTLFAVAIVTFVGYSGSACAMTPIDKMPSGVYELDKTHASLTWKVSHLGLANYTARFTDFDANLSFNVENPEASKLTVSVNPASVKTDYPNIEKEDFDKKLSEGEGWFNSAKFPEITFTSTKIEKTSGNKGKVTGDLTFLGVTKPITLDVTFNGSYDNKPFANVPALGFSATSKIKRSEWGFDTYVPTIGDEVEILIEVEFHKKAESE